MIPYSHLLTLPLSLRAQPSHSEHWRMRAARPTFLEWGNLAQSFLYIRVSNSLFCVLDVPVNGAEPSFSLAGTIIGTEHLLLSGCACAPSAHTSTQGWGAEDAEPPRMWDPIDITLGLSFMGSPGSC